MSSTSEILIEDKQYDFLNESFPRPSSFIRRFSQGSKRYYYTVENGEVDLYASGTTIIKDGYAEDTKYLEEWRNKLKAEGKSPSRELTFLATRGTIMHTLYGDVIQGISIPLTDIYGYIMEKHPELQDQPLFHEVIDVAEEWLQKALLSFVKFVQDYKIKPLAIELMLKSEKYKVATPVDMLCEMTIQESGPWGEPLKSGPNKGEPKIIKRDKVIVAIVDFKSSQAGFFDKHYFQLQLNKRIVAENYPKLNVEGLFNFSPKEGWRTKPDYNLKDQTEGPLDGLCELVFEQGKWKHLKKEPSVKVYKNEVSINMVETDFETVFERIPLIEYLKSIHGERTGQ